MNVRSGGCVLVLGVVALMASWMPTITAPADPGVRIEPAPALTLPPELDDFFQPSAGMVAAAQSGEILRARQIYPAFMGLLQLNVDAWQLLYRTNFNYLGTFQGADPLSLPEIRDAIADNSLGQQRPSVPIYFYHAQNDELIPIGGTDAAVDKYCREGAPSVTYVREFAAEHLSGVVSHLPGAFYWLKDRLNGVAPPAGCAISSPVSTLTEPQFGQALSELLPPMAQALVGQAIGTHK